MNAIAHKATLVLIACTTLATAQAGELFRWVDKDGKVYYSDTPPPADAKSVQQKRYVSTVSEGSDIPYAVKIAMENNPVTFYTNNCPEGCVLGKALLTKRGIPFIEKNPETDGKAREALGNLTDGQMIVPTLAIGTNTIKGYSDSAWQSALDSAGYPRTNPNLKPGTVPPMPAASKPDAAPAK